jgi:hypothetical protein
MKVDFKLLILALVPNCLSFLFYRWALSQPGSSGALLGFIVGVLPIIWITTIIVAYIQSRRGYLIWFQKSYILTSTILLILITPIPFIYLLQKGLFGG